MRAVVIFLGGMALLIAISASLNNVGKSPRELARERARDCMEAAQHRMFERGYRSASDIQTGAVMECSEELRALKQYE